MYTPVELEAVYIISIVCQEVWPPRLQVGKQQLSLLLEAIFLFRVSMLLDVKEPFIER
ncbi:MAG: hypothetical protein ACMUEM_03115 [Flavobacteriales bacterium AspAUS03]